MVAYCQHLSTYCGLSILLMCVFLRFQKKGWHRKSEISARVGHNFYGWYNGGNISIFRAWDDDQDWVLSPAKVWFWIFVFKWRGGSPFPFWSDSVASTPPANTGIWPMKNGYHGNTMWYNVKCGCVYIYNGDVVGVYHQWHDVDIWWHMCLWP